MPNFILLLVKKGEEVVNLQGLRGTKGYIDKIDKKEVEEEAEEEALLPCWGVKYNILCILYR